MKYKRITDHVDADIPFLTKVLLLPEISRYISINVDNYWTYVTQNDGVKYFKAYRNGRLVGALHCEMPDKTLYLSVLVIPEYQRQGIGTEILKDVLRGKLMAFETVEVSVDEKNVASVKLFEKMGFIPISQEDGLVIYTYKIPVEYKR